MDFRMTTVLFSTILLFLIDFRHCQADTSLCEMSSNCSNGIEQFSFIQLLMTESYFLVEDSIVLTIWSWLVEYQAWILSIIGSSVVGLSGIFPLLVIPIEEGANLKTGAAASTLRVLLSFAVGGLLGDVFLHLLPEAWAAERPPYTTAPGTRGPRPSMTAGLWVLAGILLFTILEMACPDPEEKDEEEGEAVETEEQSSGLESHINNNLPTNNTPLLTSSKTRNGSTVPTTNGNTNGSKMYQNGNSSHSNHINGTSTYTNGTTNGVLNSKAYLNGIIPHTNGSITKLRNNESTQCNGHTEHKNGVNGNASKGAVKRPSVSGGKAVPPVKHVAGYLNLLANSIDNFMHGLAVGGGFLVSVKMGALTTLAILIHEVPHEIGDFAILLRAGFSRWDAARAQLYTAGSGLLGALTAVACSTSTVESRTSWVVPFTAGGFLHIALVTVLPELLAERDKWESAKQLAGLLTGMFVMAVLTACFE